MTSREDIYDHLAQVYLGKRKEADIKKKKQFSAWLIINVLITFLIFASAFYGLTAFLARKGIDRLEDNIIFSLSHGTMKLSYDFSTVFHPDETLSLSIPKMDAVKYKDFQFSIRAHDGETPGVVKVVFKNKRNESSSFYVENVSDEWKKVAIPLSKFNQITDWSSLNDISFVVESWNVKQKQGSILIDDICFANASAKISVNQKNIEGE